eukprot:gb/GEZN01013444.1/.p1 GENE.gb/GEZN01013444.1/~~gb/GEZN01013444.1/.p1  ORF type:complete len:231 (+),score=35.18 gb/GEZN01013444.1/:249-941(+)
MSKKESICRGMDFFVNSEWLGAAEGEKKEKIVLHGKYAFKLQSCDCEETCDCKFEIWVGCVEAFAKMTGSKLLHRSVPEILTQGHEEAWEAQQFVQGETSLKHKTRKLLLVSWFSVDPDTRKLLPIWNLFVPATKGKKKEEKREEITLTVVADKVPKGVMHEGKVLDGPDHIFVRQCTNVPFDGPLGSPLGSITVDKGCVSKEDVARAKKVKNGPTTGFSQAVQSVGVSI